MYSNLRDVEVGFSQEQIDTIPSEILKSGMHWLLTCPHWDVRIWVILYDWLDKSSIYPWLKEDFTEYECIVCLEPMKKGEEVRTLPCTHKLHTECIDPWLRSNKVCPVCRSGIPLTQRWHSCDQTWHKY